MKKYIIIIASLAGIIACGKDKVTDTTAPVISITSPTTGQMIMSGDSALVDVTVTDVDLHEVTFTVRNAADTSIEYFTDGMYSHSVDLHYVQKFKTPAVPGHTPVILFVHAEDHNSNESEKSVTFAIMP